MHMLAIVRVGCDVSSPNKIGTVEYYVQIQREGEIKGNERVYTLFTYDKEGTEKKVTSTSQKPNNEKLKENAFLRLYIKQEGKEKADIPDTEVKSYEEIQKDDLPAKTKEQLGVK
ncbi:cytoplasmic protein (plasmid) [Bacillus tropicus]|nr:cytoplasmic protein [Bacillus cereus]